MLRQIIIPNQNTITINLPDEMIGKQVEVIAFEITQNTVKNETETMAERLLRIQAIFADVHVKMSDFKFNRDEANDYSR
jgi:hypothetical protein